MSAHSADRVILARKENSMRKYRWTGAEPDGLNDLEVAESLGAKWEGDELVTYDLVSFTQLYDYHTGDDYLIDND